MPTIASSHVQPPPSTDVWAHVPPAPRWMSELPALPAALRSESFGQWLTAQRDRGDGIDQLASWARGQGSFPRHGTVAEVRRWLAGQDSDQSSSAHLQAAERCWLTL